MSLSLDGSTGIITGLDVTTSQLPSGSILQVVEGGTSSQVTLNTTTYIDSGLSASITPSSSTSKILVLLDQSCEWAKNTGSGGMGVRVLRDAVIINEPQATTVPLTDYIANGNQHYFRLSMTILDSPATTNSVTYKTQGRTFTGCTAHFQAGSNTKGASRIVLMEVAV